MIMIMTMIMKVLIHDHDDGFTKTHFVGNESSINIILLLCNTPRDTFGLVMLIGQAIAEGSVRALNVVGIPLINGTHISKTDSSSV